VCAGQENKPGTQTAQLADGKPSDTSHRAGEKKEGSPTPPGALGSHSQAGGSSVEYEARALPFQ